LSGFWKEEISVLAKSTVLADADPRPTRPIRAFRDFREQRLFIRYHADGDLEARKELIERLLPLARRLAGRYAYTDEPQEDLVQVACVGLIKALDRFDPGRGVTFASYAVPTMLGELRRHFRDKSWAAHVPRATQERALEVNRAIATLSTRLGHVPTTKEIARHLNASSEEVLEAMEAATAYDALSFESLPPSDDGESLPYAETVGDDEPGFQLVELGDAIAGTLDSLSPRERMIIHLRFVRDLTQSEIGAQVGVSQMHVSRLLRRSLEKLRAARRQAVESSV
jgi:RNA polymerase sigma-B factor